jgi:hypothetical protein
MMNEYERAVLRHQFYPSRGSGVIPGAAFNAAMESLTGSGYIRDGLITAKGAEVMGYPRARIPRARVVGFAALVVAALAMIAVLALALYGAQHVLQTMGT